MHHWTIVFFALAMSFYPVPTFARKLTQAFTSTWQLNQPPVNVHFEPFDTMSGLRELTSVSLGFQGELAMEVLVQNYTSLELEPDDWYYDAAANVMVSFAEQEGFENGGPFWGVGGVFIQDITGRLSPGSGGSPFENPIPGRVDVSAMVGDEINTRVTSDNNLDYYQSGPLEATMAPFFDFAVTPPTGSPDGFIDANVIDMLQSGTLTLEYEFSLPDDCNGDGFVDAFDLTCVCGDAVADLDTVLWATGLILGDLDADGVVGLTDLMSLSSHFGAAGDYHQGDIDCSGTVDFDDFLQLAVNFDSRSGRAPVSVPEPTANLLLLAGMAAIGLARSDRCRR